MRRPKGPFGNKSPPKVTILSTGHMVYPNSGGYIVNRLDRRKNVYKTCTRFGKNERDEKKAFLKHCLPRATDHYSNNNPLGHHCWQLYREKLTINIV